MKKLQKIDGACAVCALCYVSALEEDTVLRVCTLHGFKEGQGMFDNEWQAAARQLDVDFRGIGIEPLLLKQFIKNYSEGLYLVATSDHIFVVDNGIVIDPRYAKAPGLRRKIKQAWRVLKD